jgi:hypothetical protein
MFPVNPAIMMTACSPHLQAHSHFWSFSAAMVTWLAVLMFVFLFLFDSSTAIGFPTTISAQASNQAFVRSLGPSAFRPRLRSWRSNMPWSACRSRD